MESQRDHRAITVEDEQESGTESLSTDQIQEMIEKPAFIGIKKLLDESEKRMKSEDNMMLSPDRSNSSRNSVCIYRVPPSLKEPGYRYFRQRSLYTGLFLPEYYDDNTKSDLVNSLLNQSLERKEVLLQHLVRAMEKLETKVRDCCSYPIEMSSDGLVAMLVLNGCTVVEVLRQGCLDDGNQSLKRPEVIKELTGDLLLMENQLPFFVLEKIFEICIKKGGKSDPLGLVALKLFSQFLPISDPELLLKRAVDPDSKVQHLLDLFHYSCRTPISNSLNYDQRQPMTRRFPRWISVAFRYPFKTITPTQHGYHQLSDQSIRCATRLRRAGIKLWPRKKPNSLLQIKFRYGVLEIPPIDDITLSILWNCVAWEQCHPNTCRYFSAYIGFMNYLMKSDKDVRLLREERIIRSVAYQDKKILDIFRTLGDNVVYDPEDCYFSKQVNEVETFCRSNWASLRLTYFSSPWAFISVVAATLALVLTGIQTIMAIWAYVKPPS